MSLYLPILLNTSLIKSAISTDNDDMEDDLEEVLFSKRPRGRQVKNLQKGQGVRRTNK